MQQRRLNPWRLQSIHFEMQYQIHGVVVERWLTRGSVDGCRVSVFNLPAICRPGIPRIVFYMWLTCQ